MHDGWDVLAREAQPETWRLLQWGIAPCEYVQNAVELILRVNHKKVRQRHRIKPYYMLG